jgi:AbiV family abortive infection protein
MRTRAIRDLAQLPDEAVFEELSTGLDLVFKNASRLDEDAQALWNEGRSQGSEILTAICAEEAAKFLILIDAIRCPSDRLSSQLNRFYDHLAKGIYAECCEWRAGSLGELVSYVREELAEFYLDGPNDIDWIFRNRILSQREEQLYIDYIATDDGHYWTEPRREELFPLRLKPRVLVLIGAMHAAGFATSKALETIAEIWRPVLMHDDYPWHELCDLNTGTVDAISSLIGSPVPAEDYEQIIDLWPFPLHSLGLRVIPVDREELRKTQRAWSPDL